MKSESFKNLTWQNIYYFFQSEYISKRDFRVRFLSGFSGSNAFVLVTAHEALLWTDGRYFIQVEFFFIFELIFTHVLLALVTE